MVQGRVTDHRVGLTEHGIEGMLSGANLDSFLDALGLHHKQQLLAGLN
jgi:peptide chain release factor 1